MQHACGTEDTRTPPNMGERGKRRRKKKSRKIVLKNCCSKYGAAHVTTSNAGASPFPHNTPSFIIVAETFRVYLSIQLVFLSREKKEKYVCSLSQLQFMKGTSTLLFS